MYPAIYRPDPSPQHAVPFVPIPSSGGNPPPRTTALLYEINALWPRDNWAAQRAFSPIVPLTLPTGQQPPIGANPFTVSENVVYASWPPLWYPAQTAYPGSAATNLTYGQQPPTWSPDLIYETRMTWSIDWSAQTSYQGSAATNLPYGSPPPAQPPDVFYELRLAWPQESWAAQSAYSPIVPLTLTYGSQPPLGANPLMVAEKAVYASWPPLWYPPQVLIGTAAWNVPIVSQTISVSPVTMMVIVRSWQPPDPLPQQPTRYIAPQTLTYGSQPPPSSTDLFYELRLSWPQESWPAQKAFSPIVPLTLTYGRQVPYTGVSTMAEMQANLLWQPPWIAPPQPAPLTLGCFLLPLPDYVIPLGNPSLLGWMDVFSIPDICNPAPIPPPPSSTAMLYELRMLWPQESWGAQSAYSGSAATNLAYGSPPPAQPNDVFYELRLSWPQESWSAQSIFNPVATFPLTYGSVIAPYSIVLASEIVLSWQPPWLAPQKLVPVGSWDVPPIPQSTALMMEIISLWRVPDPMPQQATRYIAPQTLVYGSQPAPHTTAINQIVSMWQPITQVFPPPQVAGWDFIYLVIPYAPLSQNIISAWRAPDPMPTLMEQIAPMTLPTGQQPPTYSTAVTAEITSFWQPLWVSPPPLPGVGAWQLTPPQPYFTLPQSIIASWRAPDPTPAIPVHFAPLTLPTGQQPPFYSTAVQIESILAWQPIWVAPPQTVPLTVTTVTPPIVMPPQATPSLWALLEARYHGGGEARRKKLKQQAAKEIQQMKKELKEEKPHLTPAQIARRKNDIDIAITLYLLMDE